MRSHPHVSWDFNLTAFRIKFGCSEKEQLPLGGHQKLIFCPRRLIHVSGADPKSIKDCLFVPSDNPHFWHLPLWVRSSVVARRTLTGVALRWCYCGGAASPGPRSDNQLPGPRPRGSPPDAAAPAVTGPSGSQGCALCCACSSWKWKWKTTPFRVPFFLTNLGRLFRGGQGQEWQNRNHGTVPKMSM